MHTQTPARTLNLNILIILVTLVIGCGALEQKDEPAMSELFSGVEAGDGSQGEAEESVTPAADEDETDEALLLPESRLYLAIRNEAFGKEFLLHGSVIPQVEAATSHGLAGKIVRFERYPESVDLYESEDGQVVTDDLPVRRLLATFPIKSATDEKVVVDFNAGMNRVFNAKWYSGDKTEFSSALSSQALEVLNSRVFSVSAHQHRLVLRQSVRVRAQSILGESEALQEVRYFLSPYRQTDFEPREREPSKHVRYFATHPRLELNSGKSVSYIHKFDAKDSIDFYYSSNTPDEYVEAIKDGVEYWNKAFGREVVKAKRAPEGVTAPDPDHNVIQWVPWDSAGSAYADVLADPRTGQSLHGQIYLTSVFAFKTIERVRELRRVLGSDAEESDAQEPTIVLGVDFMSSAASCNFASQDFQDAYARSLGELLRQPDLSDSDALRASQDTIREVVAHEVGHVLGLRHNFAGSLHKTLSEKEFSSWLNDYLNGDEKPLDTDDITGSVMDYAPAADGFAIGYGIRTGDSAYAYDRAAIQWGYEDDDSIKDQKLLFCTDDQLSTYLDCAKFDSSKQPIAAESAKLYDFLDHLPARFVEVFVEAKGEGREVQSVNPNLDWAADQFTKPLANILKWFDPEQRSLAVERLFPFVGDLNRDKVLVSRWENLKGQVEAAGGVNRLLFEYLPVALEEDSSSDDERKTYRTHRLIDQVSEILSSPPYGEFEQIDGETYSFNAEEREYIASFAEVYFEKLEEEVLREALETLADATFTLGTVARGYPVEDEFDAEVEQGLIAVAEYVVLAYDHHKEREGLVDGGTIRVAEPRYSVATRRAAGDLLSSGVGSFEDWADKARSDLKDRLKEQVAQELDVEDYGDVSDLQLSRSLQQWYADEKDVIFSF